MIRALKSLIGLAMREDASTDELAPSLPVAEAELADARKAYEAAGEAYKASILTADDGALRKLREACKDTAIRVERAEELVRVLSERMAGAQAREAEAGRIERYEATRRRADDAAAALTQMYPQFARTMVDLLEEVMCAEVEIIAVNNDLPEGAARLPMIEKEIRSSSNDGWLPPFGETLSLPGLRPGEPWFYKPIERPFATNTQPADVLHRIRQRIL